MKKIGIVLVVLFLSFNHYSQNTNSLFELQKRKVEIDIDRSFFTNVTTNMYVSKNPDALIIALFLPISYKDQKAKINRKPIVKGLEFKGEKKLNNKNILLLSGTVIKKGTEFTKQKYYIKQDKNTCIELTTMLAVNADAKDKMMLTEIVNSVIEKN
ncbi:hypothetical protein MPF19_10795 [Polaribacter sp. Z014]|uniref:hypothetical protein n=1 Tax=Polaribacter sp. Z014 TaxID=2927126 RepID=UPI0020227209|nr:hypothetical protein [Polaribacter sp. Z014]MCL7763905.1 hypothetical protein [Polaribacter sp. Z014]